MPNAIVITLPHRLGAAEAKKRIAERMETLRRDYIDKFAHTEAVWSGDTADVRVVAFGQVVTGKVTVMSDAVHIEVNLPWFFAALTGPIQNGLKSNAEETLRIGHSPPKA